MEWHDMDVYFKPVKSMKIDAVPTATRSKGGVGSRRYKTRIASRELVDYFVDYFGGDAWAVQAILCRIHVVECYGGMWTRL